MVGHGDYTEEVFKEVLAESEFFDEDLLQLAVECTAMTFAMSTEDM